MLAATAIGLMIAYFFYYTHSALGGQPRYWSESMPMMLLLVAIALVALRRRLPSICRALDIKPAVRTGRSACWLAGLLIAIWGMPPTYELVFHGWGFDTWTRGERHRVHQMVTEAGLDNALVFMKTGDYRLYGKSMELDMYGYAFLHNDPDLKGSVLYARDLGERNAELIAHYPDRKVYKFVHDPFGLEDRLVPISSADVREGEVDISSQPP
jgi:hypothetical protein